MMSTEDHLDALNLIAPVRSIDIWYDDGNVVLEAEGVHFKLHKSILAKSSSVFQDMFAFPQPPASDAEMIEGCPVVRLSDSAEEVLYVLQALFQLKYITSAEAMPLPVLEALLSLGKKYDFHTLHAEARKRIFGIFPIKLKGYDAVTDHWHGLESAGEASYPSLLRIARRTGLMSVLPPLLYQCFDQYEADEIHSGWRSEEEDTGTIVGRFTDQDARILLAGSIAIGKASVQTTYRWLYGPGNLYAGCQTPEHCHAGREKALRSFRGMGADVPSPLDKWTSWPCLYTEGGLCNDCANLAEDAHEAGRKKFWQLLPGLFNLPSWAELSKEREDIE